MAHVQSETMRHMRHTYCTAPGCEDATRQGRRYCELHEKRHQRGQSLTEPKAERLSPKARLLEAAISLADADGDGEYEKAERDVVRAARGLVPSSHGELVRQGMARARRRGVRLGRPPALTPDAARALVAQHGSMSKAAQAAGVRRETLWRTLGRVAETIISQRAA